MGVVAPGEKKKKEKKKEMSTSWSYTMHIGMLICKVWDQLAENNLIDMDSTRNIVKSGQEVQDFRFPQHFF